MTGQPAPHGCRKVSLLGIVMFGVGSAIGVSIFSVLQPVAEIAGSGLLLSMMLASLPMMLFASSDAYLSRLAPVTGASYEWPRRFLHPAVGFGVAWLRILGCLCTLSLLVEVLVNQIGLGHSPWCKPVGIAAICFVCLLNLQGVRMAARAQITLMAALLGLFALYVIAGSQTMSIARIDWPSSWNLRGILTATPLMMTLFLGIEAAAEIGEEVRHPKRTIPLGIGCAVGLTLLVYVSIGTVTIGILGPAALARSQSPLLDAACLIFGRGIGPVLAVVAVISILKTINTTILVFSRLLVSMARTGVFPGQLATLHPRRGTPDRALLVVCVCAILAMLLPMDIIFKLLAINLSTMVKYGACALCAARVAMQPSKEMAAQRRRGMVAVGWAGGCAAILVAIAGLQVDWRPYALMSVWTGLGCLVILFTLRRRRDAAFATTFG